MLILIHVLFCCLLVYDTLPTNICSKVIVQHVQIAVSTVGSREQGQASDNRVMSQRDLNLPDK